MGEDEGERVLTEKAPREEEEERGCKVASTCDGAGSVGGETGGPDCALVAEEGAEPVAQPVAEHWLAILAGRDEQRRLGILRRERAVVQVRHWAGMPSTTHTTKHGVSKNGLWEDERSSPGAHERSALPQTHKRQQNAHPHLNQRPSLTFTGVDISPPLQLATQSKSDTLNA